MKIFEPKPPPTSGAITRKLVCTPIARDQPLTIVDRPIGLEHPHLVLVEGDDRAVADHVHIGADRLGEEGDPVPLQLAAAPPLGLLGAAAAPAARVIRPRGFARWDARRGS